MSLSRASLAALVLAAAPAVASAAEWEVTGKVEANPLRIETFMDTYEVKGPADLVARLQAVAGMNRTVTARVESDSPGRGLFHAAYEVGLVSLSGYSTAPTAVRSEPSSNAPTTSTLDPMKDFKVVGTAGDFLQVQLADGTRGYVPAGFTSIGEDHPIARAIAESILGPIFAHTSRNNDARTFHPDGLYFEGKVTSLNPSGELGAIAQRLVGSAVVRPSLGAHKDGQPDSKIDIPGFTIRLTAPGAAIGPNPEPGDENFTFLADLTSLGKLVVAPFVTNQFDYFDAKNVYYPGGVSYKVASSSGQPRDVQLRVVPEAFTPSDPALAHPTNGAQRDQKLEAAVREGKAALRIEAQLDGGAWTPVARISMEKPLTMDNEAFHYYPDLAGRGLVPQGTVNALRAELYPQSQAARPANEAERRAEDEAKAAEAAKGKTGRELEQEAGPRKGIADALKGEGGEK